MAKENKLVFLPVGVNLLKLDPVKKHRMYCECNTKGNSAIDYNPDKVVYAAGKGSETRCDTCGTYYFTFVEKGGAKANECNLRTKQG